jgi:hypothetical protein
LQQELRTEEQRTTGGRSLAMHSYYAEVVLYA